MTLPFVTALIPTLHDLPFATALALTRHDPPLHPRPFVLTLTIKPLTSLALLPSTTFAVTLAVTCTSPLPPYPPPYPPPNPRQAPPVSCTTHSRATAHLASSGSTID